MTSPDIRFNPAASAALPATSNIPAAPAIAQPAPAAAPRDQASLGSTPADTGLIPKNAVKLDMAEPGKPEYVPGQVLVKFKDGLAATDVHAFSERFGLTPIRHFEVPEQMVASFGGDLYQFRLSPGDTVESAIERLSSQGDVAYAEPNYRIQLDDPPKHAADASATPEPTPGPTQSNEKTPNDLDSRLWGMKNTGQDGGKAGVDIGAARAWATQTGLPNGQGPLIAIIDTGIDYTHPDLAANVWNNPKEIPGDGIDNDGSGYIDDQHGANVNKKTGDPMDDNEHGTHCAGTIGAIGNNAKGVVGVNWNATMAGVKFLDANGSGSYADAVEAVLYATRIGARVTSNSWGGGGYSQALEDAFKASPALHICAAGNEGNNNDTRPSYPAGFKLPNVVAVAAHDRSDKLASFSNYGANTVHVAAPGVDIYSTKPGNSYQSLDGTSMATPHVTGVVGLLLAQDPTLTNEQIIARLVNTAVKVPEYEGKTISGGRVNVANAMKEDHVPPATPGDFHVTKAGASGMTLGWTEVGDDGMTDTASSYQVRYSDRPILAEPAAGGVTWEQATPVASGTPQEPGKPEAVRVGLIPDDKPRKLYFALKVMDAVGNASTMVTTEGTTLPAAIPFRDDMETGLANWTTTGTWGLQDVEGHGKVLTDSPAGAYGPDANTTATSRPINLAGVKNPVLIFKEKHDTEAGFDFGRVEITGDGGKTWNELAKYAGTEDWTTRTIDLKPYEGKTVQLRFRMTSDGSLQKDGFMVDDIQIAGDP